MRELVGLELRWDYRDTDGTGVLDVRAAFGGFSGRSTAWFADEGVVRFARELETYPFGDHVARMAGGFADPSEEHVGLSVRARGRRGQVGVMVHLATPSQGAVEVSEVRLEFPTTYEALCSFSSDVQHLVGGVVDVARRDAEQHS